MKHVFTLGVMIAMTACTTNPAANADKPAGDRPRVQPSPVQIPAEVDPPPPVQPGFEDPGTGPAPQPPQKN